METFYAFVQAWWGIWVWIFTDAAPAIPAAEGTDWWLRAIVGLLYYGVHLKILVGIGRVFVPSNRQKGVLEEPMPMTEPQTLGMYLAKKQNNEQWKK